jgi:hypothetical protein
MLLVYTLVAAFAYNCCALEAASDHSSCQGYSVHNIIRKKWALEADLDLLGHGCAIYGPDVPKLRLSVEYQTGMVLSILYN